MEAKRVAARAAARLLLDEHRDAHVLGVGTGSTVAMVLEELARLEPGFLETRTLLASSLDTLERLKRLGARAVLIGAVSATPDVYFDGADELVLTPGCPAIKGRGAALYLEKILAVYSGHAILVVDESKLAEQPGGLGKPLPIDVDPLALEGVKRVLDGLGVRYSVRSGSPGKDGPVVSDAGGVVIDVSLEGVDPAWLGDRLEELPGVRASGWFAGVFDEAVIGRGDGAALVYDCNRGVTRLEGSARGEGFEWRRGSVEASEDSGGGG